MTRATSSYDELCLSVERRGWRVLLYATGRGTASRLVDLVVADREGAHLARVAMPLGMLDLQRCSVIMLELLDRRPA